MIGSKQAPRRRMLPRVGRAFPGLIGILRSSFGVILIHEPFPVLDRWSANLTLPDYGRVARNPPEIADECQV
jgi:hypothetical protein